MCVRACWVPPSEPIKVEEWNNEMVVAYFESWEETDSKFYIPSKCRDTLNYLGDDYFW
jgi:hypothetical protein